MITFKFVCPMRLISHDFDNEIWETNEGGFPELKFLQIEKSLLLEWITQSSHFPRLKSLVLGSCKYLREIPQGIGEIQTLELIQLDHCSESLVRSANQIKKDRESNGNYSLQVRSDFNELNEELHEQPSIEELQSAEREGQVMDVAT